MTAEGRRMFSPERAHRSLLAWQRHEPRFAAHTQAAATQEESSKARKCHPSKGSLFTPPALLSQGPRKIELALAKGNGVGQAAPPSAAEADTKPKAASPAASAARAVRHRSYVHASPRYCSEGEPEV